MSRRVLLLAAATAALVVPAVPALVLALGAAAGAPPAAPPGAVPGIPPVLLDAYARAAAAAGHLAPGCTGLRWSVLAGIGQVESGQAAGRLVTPDGQVLPPVIGPRLDGSGAGGNTTAIGDTDGGRWDGDATGDRAVGVLQFLPGTWARLGRDGNGDGVADPHNAYDAASAAVALLCGTGPVDLADERRLGAALLRYNRSAAYVAQVLRWIAVYDQLAAAPAAAGGESPVVAAAVRWVGTPYAWGGGDASGPTRGSCCSPGGSDGGALVGFDCSGLTSHAYAAVGIRLPRTSGDQFRVGRRIPRTAGLAALRAGDLVFFALDPVTGAGVHHVGIYVGGGQMVNAARPGTTVRVEPLWLDSYAGAARPA